MRVTLRDLYDAAVRLDRGTVSAKLVLWNRLVFDLVDGDRRGRVTVSEVEFNSYEVGDHFNPHEAK